jgi:hypothetical protein
MGGTGIAPVDSVLLSIAGGVLLGRGMAGSGAEK